MQRQKEIMENLGIAFAVVMFYKFMSSIFFNGASLIWDKNFLSSHSAMIDTWLCVTLLIIYSIWLSRISQNVAVTEQDMVRDRKIYKQLPVLALGLTSFSSLCSTFLVTIMQDVPLIANSKQSYDETWSAIESEPYLWVLLSVVIIGPIVEEVLFRGLVFHYMEKIKTGWFPILVSGIAFGVSHGEPVQVIDTILAGIIFGIVYAKTRNLKATIVIHMVGNFIATLPPMLNIDFVKGVIDLAALFMIIPAVILLVRMCPKREKKQKVYMT